MIPVINYIDKLKLSQIYDLFIAAWLHVNKRSGLTKRLMWVNLVNLSEKWRLNLNHYVSNFKEHILRFFCLKNDRYLICLHINTDRWFPYLPISFFPQFTAYWRKWRRACVSVRETQRANVMSYIGTFATETSCTKGKSSSVNILFLEFLYLKLWTIALISRIYQDVL